MSHSSRLSSYTRIAAVPTVAGTAVAVLTGHAEAGLQIWSVGQALPQNQNASQDIQLSATFNAAFKINFYGTGAGDDQVFWAPNNNLSLINFGYFTYNDPAIWAATVLIGADALNGVDSIRESTSHYWFRATNSRNTDHDIHKQIQSGETGAFGIRFNDGAAYYYGWVEVSMDANEIITVERWALEDTANTAAQYTPGGGGGGAVPGLGGLAALAMGAGGVRRKRSRVA